MNLCFSQVDSVSLFVFDKYIFLLDDVAIKVWNCESGKNVANLQGHEGSIYSIKMSSDGSFGMSVGKDKYILLWDVRMKKSIASIDGTHYADMNEICFSSSPSIDGERISTSA